MRYVISWSGSLGTSYAPEHVEARRQLSAVADAVVKAVCVAVTWLLRPVERRRESHAWQAYNRTYRVSGHRKQRHTPQAFTWDSIRLSIHAEQMGSTRYTHGFTTCLEV